MMDRNSNMEIPQIVDSQLAQPHFDDERTIQTAKPVVPLEMRHRFITKRRIMLAGAFVLAAMLGAGAALALVHSRQPITANSVVSEETKVQENDATAQAAPPVEENQDTQDTLASEETESAEETPVPRQSTTRTRPAIRHTAPTVRRVSIPVSIESDDDAKALLVDEWQERRQRRVTRPLRRNEHHRSDLFRIREIFEGPRRRSQ
jgi:hypothetical protein